MKREREREREKKKDRKIDRERERERRYDTKWYDLMDELSVLQCLNRRSS